MPKTRLERIKPMTDKLTESVRNAVVALWNIHLALDNCMEGAGMPEFEIYSHNSQYAREQSLLLKQALALSSPTPSDDALFRDGCTKITKAAANLVNGEGFSSPFREDYTRMPVSCLRLIQADDTKRVTLGNEIAQGLNWIRQARGQSRQVGGVDDMGHPADYYPWCGNYGQFDEDKAVDIMAAVWKENEAKQSEIKAPALERYKHTMRLVWQELLASQKPQADDGMLESAKTILEKSFNLCHAEWVGNHDRDGRSIKGDPISKAYNNGLTRGMVGLKDALNSLDALAAKFLKRGEG